MSDLKEDGFPPSMIIAFIATLLFLVYNLTEKRKYKLPPGPVGLPVLGYLPFLGENPAVTLMKLSKKYGDIFSVNLGGSNTVVLADAAAAKQIFSKRASADRPEDAFAFLPGGAGFGEENGDKWIEQRRYTIKEMKNLGLGRSEWEKLLTIEAHEFMNVLEESKGQPVDIYKELSASISNNILTLVSNRRLPRGHPKRETLDKGIEAFQLLYDQSGLIANFPKLFRICATLGLINVREKLNDVANFSRCVRQQIDDLKKDKDGDSYIHNYLSEIDKNNQMKLGNYFDPGHLLGNVQTLIIAGSDTTKVSLLWLFLAMASYPEIQDKVYEEVDRVLGKDGKAEWVDRHKLPYCHATILEGQRWRTIAPLNVVHKTAEDMEFNGFDIPKGTNILALLYAFHANPRHWKDPEAFQPERFLAEDDGLTVKEPESFLPFSFGKRSCIGKTVALIEIFLYFVNIIQRYRILPASETSRPDLEGTLGLTLQPKRQPLRYVPR